MKLLERIVVSSAIVFGVTYMLRHTDGPGDVFVNMRKAVGIEYFEIHEDNGVVVDETVEEIPDRFLAKLFGCFWCLGTWISFITTFLTSTDASLRERVMIWLASIGVAGFLYESNG